MQTSLLRHSGHLPLHRRALARTLAPRPSTASGPRPQKGEAARPSQRRSTDRRARLLVAPAPTQWLSLKAPSPRPCARARRSRRGSRGTRPLALGGVEQAQVVPNLVRHHLANLVVRDGQIAEGDAAVREPREVVRPRDPAGGVLEDEPRVVAPDLVGEEEDVDALGVLGHLHQLRLLRLPVRDGGELRGIRARARRGRPPARG
jgi:hypothetical protein